MTESVLTLVAAAAFWIGAAGLGRWVGASWFDRPDRALVALGAPMVGMALIAIASLLLLLPGGMPLGLHAVTPGMGLLLAWQHRDRLRTDWEGVANDLGGCARATYTLAALTLGLLLLHALGPVVDWDSLTFHDRVMEQFLNADRVYVPEDNLHIAQLGLAQLATVPLRVLGVENGGAILSALASALAVVVAAVAATRIGGAGSGRLAAAAIAGTPLLLLVGMTPRVDASLAAAVLLVLLSVSTDIAEASTRRIGWSLGLAAIAAGTKFHGMAFCAVVAIPLLWQWRASSWRRLAAGFGFGIVICLPWLVMNQVHFGAPLFPFLAELRLEPWLAGVVGSPVLPPTFDTTGLDLMPSVREAFSPWRLLFSPQSLTLESEGVWYRPSLLLLLVPTIYAVRDRRAAALWVAVPLGYVAILLSVSPMTSPRYLLPAILPLLTITAAGMTTLLRTRGSSGASLVGWALMLLALGQSLVFAPSWVTGSVVGRALGLTSEDEFRHNHPDVTVRRYAGIPSLIESVVPVSGGVLMLFEARGGGIDRRVLADSRAATWPILAQTGAVEKCLEGTGVTHVLLNVGALDYYLSRGASPTALRLDRLQAFVGNCTTRVADQAGFVLLQLNPSSAGDGSAM